MTFIDIILMFMAPGPLPTMSTIEWERWVSTGYAALEQM